MPMLDHQTWMTVKPPYSYLDIAAKPTSSLPFTKINAWIEENCAGWVYATEACSLLLDNPADARRYYFESDGDQIITLMWMRDNESEIIGP